VGQAPQVLVRAGEYGRVIRRLAPALTVLLTLAVLAAAVGATAAPRSGAKAKAPSRGTLTQLNGARGCLVDRSKRTAGCATARALEGPGTFMGSRAVAVSPDGKNVYVASSSSDAVAIFKRDARSGALAQAKGKAGCVAAKGAEGCAAGVGLDGPNSVAVSGDGRNVYVTSRDANSLTAFSRNRTTGALTQLPGGAGCVSGLALPDCAGGRALVGPDVVIVSPEGNSVYVGSFLGNAVAAFSRDGATGALTQLPEAGGCIAEAVAGCAAGIALGAPEGLAIGNDGTSVYVASALSNAVAVLARDPATGTLTQASAGGGCIVDVALTGCTTGVQLSGANAVAVSPRGAGVYVTSLVSNSVTAFTPAANGTGLTQKEGTAGCLVFLRAVGCSFGRAMTAPEGLALSPDGASVYVASFETGALDVLDRGRQKGAVAQKPGRAGCLAPKSVPGCTRARALRGVSSVVVSPDGRNVYSTSFTSNAVDVFRRVK
jgi:DNA-binding beta-propeller fold protein YncE